jgi:hypothetical protein
MDGDPTRYTVPGEDGYRTTTAWPPLESKLAAFALRADGTLSTDEGLVRGARLPVFAAGLRPAASP